MKFELFNAEASKIWRNASGKAGDWMPQFDAEMYGKLFNFFQVGDYYYWVFNLKERHLDMVSNEVYSVLGYSPEEFDMERLLENVHPDDRPYFLNFEIKAGEFLAKLPVEKLMKYKVRHDFRLRTKQGNYLRFLHQAVVIQHDEKGQIFRTFGSETDITHLKPEGKPVLSFIGLDGEPSFINVDVDKTFNVSDEVLTNREKQILLLIMDGKLSKEISAELHISKQTVDSHRNNMLAKCDAANTSELIAKAIRHGWV